MVVDHELTRWSKIDRIFYKTSRVVSFLAGASLLAVAVVCTLDVFSAKIFKSSIRNGTELVTYLNIPVVFFGIAFVQMDRGHTSIGILFNRFSKGLQRVLSVIYYFFGFLICGFCGIRSWVMTGSKLQSLARASASSSSFLVWRFSAIICFGFLLLSLSFLWCAVREFTLPPESRYANLSIAKKDDLK